MTPPANITLRRWQREFRAALAKHPSDDFLLVACPAAGKTLAAGVAVADVMAARGCDQLIVVAPTVVVRSQWSSVLGSLGYRMQTRPRRDGWPAHVHGACVTYAQVAADPDRFVAACERRGTVVIFDEVHHAGEQLAWGAAALRAFGAARMRLAMSGTPFRSDRDVIPFVDYDETTGVCKPDYSYGYAQAVRDGICRPVEFRAHDGVVTWREDGEIVTAKLSDPVTAVRHPRRLRASLDPARAFLSSMLTAAHTDLTRVQAVAPRTAGLVICDNQAHARAVDALLTEIAGSVPVLATSDVPLAHKAISAFAGDQDDWLVSVRMVAEGVDIARIGVIVWATAARTELMVRQIAGRALRATAGGPSWAAIVHMPADDQLIRYAGRLDRLGSDLPAGVPRPRGDGTGTPTGPRGRQGLEALDARPVDGGPLRIRPRLPVALARPAATAPAVAVAPPPLPAGPEDLRAMEEAHAAARAAVYQQLQVYARLRAAVTPGYQIANAHLELARATGVDRPRAASDDDIARALAWVRGRNAELAAAHPDAVLALARERRRLAAA